MATATATPHVRPKEFHFPVSIEWMGERRVAANVAGKQPIEITPPPVFRGTDPSTWSPEDFLATRLLQDAPGASGASAHDARLDPA